MIITNCFRGTSTFTSNLLIAFLNLHNGEKQHPIEYTSQMNEAKLEDVNM